VHRLDGRDRRHAAMLALGQELSNRLRVGAAGVAIADIGGEEFEEPDARLVAGCDDESGGGLGRPEKDQLAHSAQGQLETGHPAMCTLLRV
jgi:hypothetical protein